MAVVNSKVQTTDRSSVLFIFIFLDFALSVIVYLCLTLLFMVPSPSNEVQMLRVLFDQLRTLVEVKSKD